MSEENNDGNGAVYGVHFLMSGIGLATGEEEDIAIFDVMEKAKENPNLIVLERGGGLGSYHSYVGLPVDHNIFHGYDSGADIVHTSLKSLDDARSKTPQLLEDLASVGITDEFLKAPVAESLELYVKL